MQHEINILMGDWRHEDKDLFFGPLRDDDAFHERPPDTSMLAILVEFGFFGSRSQARKAGWSPVVPDGYSEHRFRRHNRLLAILNVRS